MRQESFRALGFVVLAGLATGLVVHFLPRAMDAAGGPEAELAAALKGTEPDGMEVRVKGFAKPLVTTMHSYSRVTFAPAQPGQPPALAATLDLNGRLKPQGNVDDLEVSSLGVEELRFAEKGFHWEPLDGWAPRLAAVLATLEARRKALEAGDREALAALVRPQDRVAALAAPRLQEFLGISQRRYMVSRWLLRLDRDTVSVTEEGRVTGNLPSRPVDDLTTIRLRLVPAGREFFFSPGVM